MKKLISYINEERLRDQYMLWNTIDLKDKGYDEKYILDQLEEQLNRIANEAKIIYLDSIENDYNEKMKNYKVSLKNKATTALKQYKLFLKKSPEEQEKEIQKKIEEIIKSTSNYEKTHTRGLYPYQGTTKYPLVYEPKKSNVNINPEQFEIVVNNDIKQQFRHSNIIKWGNDYKALAKKIFDNFPTSDEFKENLTGIYFYNYANGSNDKYKKVNERERFYVSFFFKDEFEDQLDKSVKAFGDFMSNEYSSGRYMGD